MSETENSESAEAGDQAMTRFDDIYDRPDPRAFFRALGSFEYQTPHHAQRIFRRMLATRTGNGNGDGTREPVTVLDICCSYGINAALLNHDVTLADLYDRYGSAHIAALDTAELIEADRAYYAARRRPDAVRVVGLDVAANAVSYARAVGLLDEGFAENLESAPPSSALLEAARPTRLITVTGGASFLSPRSFRPFLAEAREPAWVAAFVLRTGSYQAIADGLSAHGLVTEKAAPQTFPQRRFTSEREQRYAVEAVTAAAEDPRGKESAGYFHTALHLSRPPRDAAAFPLTGLLSAQD
ncbi:hypothetical protein [Embleya scabrispora]|uniref:hypothetical protein n=1 Tax=Embleya scabrispora TaxID=159449 RepID=UPI00036A2BD3|nr:hypothetical protein [Embleya scabrispora]